MVRALELLPGAILWGSIIWHVLLYRFWPWDYRGNRRQLVIKKKDRQW